MWKVDEAEVWGRTGGAPGCDRAQFQPLFYADWDDVAFVHFAIDAATLQKRVPFELDLHEGRAYLSLVAFTQRRLRPRAGALPSSCRLRWRVIRSSMCGRTSAIAGKRASTSFASGSPIGWPH